MSSRRERTRFTEDQLKILIKTFNETPYPDYTTKQKLALEMDIEESRIQVWFQNRRTRHRAREKPEPKEDLESSRDEGHPVEKGQAAQPYTVPLLETSSRNGSSQGEAAGSKLDGDGGTGLGSSSVVSAVVPTPTPAPGRGQRRQRTSYTSSQLHTLISAFESNPYPGADTRGQLAEEIGVPESRVQIWFQNRRSRFRDKRNKEPDEPLEQKRDQEPATVPEESSAQDPPLPSSSPTSSPETP